MEDLGLENTPQYYPYEDETQNEQSFLQLVEELEPMPELEDHYIGAEVPLTRGDKMARGHVVVLSHDVSVNNIGIAHANSMLDPRMYHIEFAGGEVTELTTNVIVESMYAQCDADGNEYLLLDVLVDYHKDNKTMSLTEQQISIWGRPVTHKTSADWQICCQWKNDSTSWEKLSKLKESHPVQTAEFAVAQGIDHEPAFDWWVKHVLKKKTE